jgi:CBS domain-containing protein
VSDEHGALVGYVSMIDLVRDRYLNGETETGAAEGSNDVLDAELGLGYHYESHPHVTARDIMMPFVLRLPESAAIDEAAALMAVEGVHRIMVTSPSNEVVGVVSALDVLRWLAERDGYALPKSKRAKWRQKCEYVTV